MPDLSREEQTAVRGALRFMRSRFGDWVTLARALGIAEKTLRREMGTRGPSARTAIRVARLAGASIDGLLRGEFPPPGICIHCGHVSTATAATTTEG